MFQSKFFLIMSAVIAVVLGGVVTLQVLEMNDYDLFKTMFAQK